MKILALLLFVATVSASFSFQNFIVGDWEIDVYKTSLEAPGTLVFVEHISHRLIAPTENDEDVNGFFVNEHNEKHLLKVHPGDSLLSGEFLIAQVDYEGEVEDFGVIFSFDFTNYSSGHLISQGIYGDADTYQMIIPNEKAISYTLTVIQKDADGQVMEITTMLALKKLVAVERTFWQKYGMMVMMLGFFLFSRFMRSKQESLTQRTQQMAGTTTRMENDVADMAAGENPRVEELPDDYEEKKDQ